MQRSCPAGASSPVRLYDRGFIASPNYPAKYAVDADCSWHVTVQQRQTIVFTLIDFELDVKREGRCQDYVEVSIVFTLTWCII